MNDEKQTNNENNHIPVPYVVYRDSIRDVRTMNMRLVIALIVAIVLMFATNIAWLIVWNSYDIATEETITTLDSSGEGVANYIGEDGGIIVGEGNGYQAQEDDD